MTIVPLLKFAMTDELKQLTENGNGIELSRSKFLSAYNHSTQGGGWDRFHYPESDPKAELLRNAKQAMFLKDDSGATSAQTILFFMKIIRDGDTLIDCWHKENKGGEVRSINFNDRRASRGGTYGTGEDPWETVKYTVDDIKLVEKMCRAYFDKIIPGIKSNHFFSVFNAISFSRVAFSITNWDDRLFTPILATAIEALFSYGRSEITHQVAENLAWFLEADGNEARLSWYKKFKDFYDIRSEIIHSGYSDKSIEERQNAYESALDILRESIKKILLNDEQLENFKTKDSRKQFFINQILTN